MVFFEDGSPNKDIHEALREAESVRKALREEEAEKIAARTAIVEQANEPDAAPVIERRRTHQRAFSAGRSS
jgi:hypothetical protein